MTARAVKGWLDAYRLSWTAPAEHFTGQLKSVGSRPSAVSSMAWLTAFVLALLIAFTVAVLLLPNAKVGSADIPRPSGQAQTPPVDVGSKVIMDRDHPT